MLRITTESGRVYLVDQTKGAERFKRLPGRWSPFVPEDLDGKWLPLLEGSIIPEPGASAVLKYGERDTQFILTTWVDSVEEIPDTEG